MLNAKLPKREIEICHRLREVRLALHWDQPTFAAKLGISRVTLASYEYARAPIRYALARRLGDELDINQRWLATGLAPRKPYLIVHPQLESLIAYRALFTDAYDKVLKGWIEEQLRHLADMMECKPEEIDPDDARLGSIVAVGTPTAETLKYIMTRSISIRLRAMPENLQVKFFESIRKTSEEFWKSHSKEIQSFVDRRRSRSK